MRKWTKRTVCKTLSLMAAGLLSLGFAFFAPVRAEASYQTKFPTLFEEVTAQFDITKLRESQFNKDIFLSSGEENETDDTDESKLIPYGYYGAGEYLIPLGEYVYKTNQPEKVGKGAKYCAISCYNEDKYVAFSLLKSLYAQLPEEAQVLRYTAYNEATGENIIYYEAEENERDLELSLNVDDYGFYGNQRYRFKVEYELADELTGIPRLLEEDFLLTVDLEAPILENAKITIAQYKERITFLELDVFDNLYPQAVTLCYPQTDKDGNVTLKQALQYPVHFENINRNATTVLRVDITRIYDYLYKTYGQVYVQIDDYALNGSIYRIDLSAANAAAAPDDFQVVQETLTLGINETHLVGLRPVDEPGTARFDNLENFLWTSKNPTVADVRNGEIVGLSEGTTEIFVSNRKGVLKSVQVTVDGTKKLTLEVPQISLGVIEQKNGLLKLAQGNSYVSEGEAFLLDGIIRPWYHSLEGYELEWTTSNPDVVAVNGNGYVRALKSGSELVSLVLYKVENGKRERLQAVYTRLFVEKATEQPNATGVLTANGVQNVSSKGELRIQNAIYSLDKTELIKVDESVTGEFVVPSGVEIIASGAFENTGVEKVFLPKTVRQIQVKAFARALRLSEISVEEESEYYFAEDGVLYRYILGTDNYELVSYPTACQTHQEYVKQEKYSERIQKTYEIKEGAVRVEAYAFYGLGKNGLEMVIFPFSMKTIGDGAFYQSGIKEYRFKCKEAPFLETSVDSETLSLVGGGYRGYYHKNFDVELVTFSDYGSETSGMVMHVPDYSVGYDNHIYQLYFGTSLSLGVLIQNTQTQKEPIWDLGWTSGQEAVSALIFIVLIIAGVVTWSFVLKKEQKQKAGFAIKRVIAKGIKKIRVVKKEQTEDDSEKNNENKEGNKNGRNEDK